MVSPPLHVCQPKEMIPSVIFFPYWSMCHLIRRCPDKFIIPQLSDTHMPSIVILGGLQFRGDWG